MKDGCTLSHPDPAIRRFWIQHGIRCREMIYTGVQMPLDRHARAIAPGEIAWAAIYDNLHKLSNQVSLTLLQQ